MNIYILLFHLKIKEIVLQNGIHLLGYIETNFVFFCATFLLFIFLDSRRFWTLVRPLTLLKCIPENTFRLLLTTRSDRVVQDFTPPSSFFHTLHDNHQEKRP